jgi:hypothetical protein
VTLINLYNDKEWNSMIKQSFMAAAVSGILLGSAMTALAGEADDNTGKTKDKAAHDKAAQDKHACKGQNACKGQGGCKSDKHACKAQNACKGQGGCKAA